MLSNHRKKMKHQIGRVEGGVFHPQGPLTEFEGCMCVLEKAKSIRSLEQNDRYWKLIEIISEQTGNDKQAIHAYLKKQFLSKISLVFGEFVDLVGSTTKLSTKAFKEYVDKCEVHAQEELGVNLDDFIKNQGMVK
jgi:hypothetical protein